MSSVTSYPGKKLKDGIFYSSKNNFRSVKMSTKDLTIFSDLTLCLDDGEYQLTMLVHKFVLYLHCPYFEKLLTNGREKNMDNIIIMVPDTHIVRDIIMSFYSVDIKYASKKELLLHQICMDYLGLHQKKSN